MKHNICIQSLTLLFLFFIPPLLTQANNKTIVSKIVGRVGDSFLTSREVIGGFLLEKSMQRDQKIMISETVTSPEFVRQVTSALLEKVVALEAENFSLAQISDEEQKETFTKSKKILSTQKQWLKYNFSDVELQDYLIRKMRSKKFLKYKTEASSLTVSDFEIKDYYEKNRHKFGTLPLESFKDNIRQFLIQKQSEDRLREWFEVLRKKYQVRNFMAEAAG